MNNIYSKKVMQHFLKPINQGEIKKADAVGEVGNIRCGDVLKIFLKIKNNKIIDAKFKTMGCAAAIAASDALCELIKGKTIEEALMITHQDIIDYLGGLPSIKIHCSVLGRDALQEAIKNYKKKIKK